MFLEKNKFLTESQSPGLQKKNPWNSPTESPRDPTRQRWNFYERGTEYLLSYIQLAGVQWTRWWAEDLVFRPDSPAPLNH